jgi:dienelactone hydrolase
MHMRRLSITTCSALALFVSGAAQAAVKTRSIEYKQGKGTFQGFVAWDDAAKGKRPGVLVIHAWWGNNQHAHNQATRLAKAGYVGFALDLYGKGKITTHPEDAKTMMSEAMKDPAAIKARFDAALEQLKKDPHVDKSKIAVVGYCMGGTVALDMADAGVTFEAISYAGAKHGFTDPEADKAKMDALGYNAEADTKSWENTMKVFKEVFGS